MLSTIAQRHPLPQTASVAYRTVQWANGLDIDPEWLYEDSVPAQ